MSPSGPSRTYHRIMLPPKRKYQVNTCYCYLVSVSTKRNEQGSLLSKLLPDTDEMASAMFPVYVLLLDIGDVTWKT